MDYIKRSNTSKLNSTYDRVKQFIENELHIELTFYQEDILKNMLDEDVQNHLNKLYNNE